MSNQIEDSGAVIGYRPKLEYVKELNDTSTVEENKTSTVGFNKPSSSYSSTVQGLIDNLPSKPISNINYSINTIRNLVDALSKQFNGEQWNEYNEISSLLTAIESNNKDYVVNFVNYHKYLITGSIIPEIIMLMKDEEKRLQTLNEVLKELYYGNPKITDEETKEIDDVYIDRIKKIEQTGKISSINYLTISYDSMINRCTSMYSFNVNKTVSTLSKITSSENEITSDSGKKNILKSLFDTTNKDIDVCTSMYEAQQSIEIMKKTLYNYYNKRSQMNDLYDMFNGDELFPLANRLYEYQEEVNKSISNIAGSFLANQQYLSKMTLLEKEKHNLMYNYSKLNYKT